jgi:phosphatidylserine/phosphatidylglycerophosphate/cardiolipin synthase-like enzyme
MREQFIKRLLILTLMCCLPYFLVLAHSEAYFSPDDHPADRLIQIIKESKRKIYAAVYMFTDALIAQALIDAKKRGVDVKMIVDHATVDYEYGKGAFLKKNGIDVYVFYTAGKKAQFGTALMHNKFALIDEKLWTGSFNWTRSANQRNQENVILTTNKKVYARFEKQFDVLKSRAVPLGLCRQIDKQDDDVQRKNEDSEISSLWEKLKDFFAPPIIKY